MHCGARADRTEAQAQMPRSGQYLGVSTGSTSGDSEDQTDLETAGDNVTFFLP